MITDLVSIKLFIIYHYLFIEKPKPAWAEKEFRKKGSSEMFRRHVAGKEQL